MVNCDLHLFDDKGIRQSKIKILVEKIYILQQNCSCYSNCADQAILLGWVPCIEIKSHLSTFPEEVPQSTRAKFYLATMGSITGRDMANSWLLYPLFKLLIILIYIISHIYDRQSLAYSTGRYFF